LGTLEESYLRLKDCTVYTDALLASRRVVEVTLAESLVLKGKENSF